MEFLLTPYCSHSACCLCRIFAIDSTGILLHSYPPRNHLPWPALLARGQYLGFLGIPLGNACSLAIILSRSPVLVYSTPQHKKSVARWFTSHISAISGRNDEGRALGATRFRLRTLSALFLAFPSCLHIWQSPFYYHVNTNRSRSGTSIVALILCSCPFRIHPLTSYSLQVRTGQDCFCMD